MEEIRRILKETVKDYAKQHDIVINLNNFDNLDLKNYFDETELYDFEITVEDKFFEGEDIIPDGLFTKTKDLIKFIYEELKEKEELEEEFQ